MKFFKIFKKKPPPSSPRSTNLVCNIHWAETVQREMAQTASKDTATSPRQVPCHCYMTILGGKCLFQSDDVQQECCGEQLPKTM